MTGVFFTLRIAVIPLNYYNMYAMHWAEGATRLGYVPVTYIAVGGVLDLINVMWFLQLLRSAREVLHNNRVVNEERTVPEVDCKQKQT